VKFNEVLNVSKPRYIRVAQAVQLYGLSRPVIFRLIANRSIRSVSVTQPGLSRGSRLIDVESFEQFLSNLAEAQA